MEMIWKMCGLGVSGVSGVSLKKPDLAYGSKNGQKKVKIFLSDFQ